MITASEFRQAARLVDKDWAHGSPSLLGYGYCPVTALFRVSDDMEEWAKFDPKTPELNDAHDCTKDAAVMFLLMCAEAREQGDL